MKTDQALAEISDLLAAAAFPAVAWSGGGDSQVLLDLVRRVRPEVPLWWIRQDYTERAAHRWHYEFLAVLDAEVYDTFPAAWSWVSDGHDVDLLAVFAAGGKPLSLLFEVEQCDQGECVFDVTARTETRQSGFPFTLLLSGQRNGDADGWGNRVSCLPAVRTLTATKLAYPLRDWSDGDVASYVAERAVRMPPQPQQGQTVRACARCLTANGRDVVCPQSGRVLQTQTFDYAAQQQAWRQMMERNNEQNA